MNSEAIQAYLDPLSLIVRGGFHPAADAGVPCVDPGTPTRTLVLVGNAGRSMWSVFHDSELAESRPDPMNTWTREVLGRVAADLGAGVVFPFGDPPHHPFQRWARWCEPVFSSPIGILIHPEYGLWHAYRGALLFAEVIELPARVDSESPCLTCKDQPCLSTCPVSAFSSTGYDVPACATYLHERSGNDCLELGCRARRSCPVGRDQVYEPAQANFHMRSFASAVWRRLGIARD